MIAFDDNTRVAGRVHALVRPPKGSGLSLPRIRPLLSGGSNARHHPPARKLRVDEIIRVAGRVHAVVGRRRAGMAAST